MVRDIGPLNGGLLVGMASRLLADQSRFYIKRLALTRPSEESRPGAVRHRLRAARPHVADTPGG
ncbi:hypothetical protein BVI434_1500004 [Burkholderia vietnamiensis]|nr:hypothetical protein BVI434_1500004 [Burkholderia vietnamiensis]CAG9207726.1 hypothetical protein BVI1335_1930014 [Burkholderia vietnamiensis]